LRISEAGEVYSASEKPQNPAIEIEVSKGGRISTALFFARSAPLAVRRLGEWVFRFVCPGAEAENVEMSFLVKQYVSFVRVEEGAVP